MVEYYTIDRRETPEVIMPSDFPQKVTDIEEASVPRDREKPKYDDFDADDGELMYSNEAGAMVRPERKARVV